MHRAGLLGAGSLMLFALACTPGPPPRLSAEDTVVIALRNEPETLFAPAATSSEALTVLGAMTEGLVVEDENGELEPRLAERVPTLENGDAVVSRQADGKQLLRVRFTLREGARWQDGAPVRPTDIRFGWLLVGNRDTKAAQSGAAARIQDIKAIDDRTVEIVYRPGDLDPRYALCCNAFLLPEARLRDSAPAKVADSAFARDPIYAGPFALKEQKGSVSLTLERSPYYAPTPAKLKTIVFVFRSDPSLLLQDLGDHRVDVAAGVYGTESAGALAALEPRAVRTRYTPALALEHIDFNLRDPADLGKPHPILAAQPVRAALALAIDRDTLAAAATGARAPVPLSYVPPPSWAAPTTVEVTTYGFDPPAAERMLDAAGWPRGPDGVRAHAGVRMALRVLVASGSAQRDQAARQVADALDRIGAAVSLQSAPMSAMSGAKGPLATGQFDLAIYAWVGDRDPNTWSLLYQRDQIPSPANGFAGQNFTGWRDDRFSALAEEAATMLDAYGRRTRYAEMQRIWTREVPALPLYQRVQVDVADARLRELRPQPTRRPLTWNVARWSFSGA
jgi:peptide/nickel transport system substrate-binding protein